MAVNYLFKKAEDDANVIGVGHFYFHYYTQKGRQTPSHVAARILKQIVNQITPSETLEKAEKLEKLYDNSKKDCPPQSSQLVDLCIEYSSRFDKMYVLIDGLDECETDRLRDEIIDMLMEFEKSEIKILLTSQSQYLERVRDNFTRTDEINFESMSVVEQNKDWRTYIKQQLEKERNA